MGSTNTATDVLISFYCSCFKTLCWVKTIDSPWARRANCFSSALQHSRWWCRSPSRQKSCCKSSESDPHPGPGFVWTLWQTLKKSWWETEPSINLINFFFLLALSVPFYNPDETEEQVGYSGQQVGQRQIVGHLWKVYFVHLVVAVEEVGLFQKALKKIIRTKRVRKPHVNSFFFSSRDHLTCNDLLHQTADL